MILVANPVPSASFRDEQKAIFFQTAMGTMLFSCRVNICTAKTFLKLSETTTSLFLKILQISLENACVGVFL